MEAKTCTVSAVEIFSANRAGTPTAIIQDLCFREEDQQLKRKVLH